MDRPPALELQKQALWLFGVLVGLAIKEAITNVYDDVIERKEFWGGLLEAGRLFLFLLVILRFYLGAIQYFHAAYGPAVTQTEPLSKRFGTDFLFGFLHFTIFCLWGLSTSLTDARWWLFPVVLIVVLFYDLGWYVMAGNDTRKMIRIWAAINAVTATIAMLLFAVSAFLFMAFANQWQMFLAPHQAAICETIAWVPVLFASVLDLGGLLYGTTDIERWLGESVHRPRILGGRSDDETPAT